MYIRQCFRTVEGERRAYWALVESVRTERGPRQNVVAWLGALDEAGHLGVLQAARCIDNDPVSNVDSPKFFQQSLFEFEDTPVEPRWVRVNTNAVRVENSRSFGGPWLALQLIEQLKLDELLLQMPRLWEQGESRPTHQPNPTPGLDYRTIRDPFEGDWTTILEWLQTEPDVAASSLLERLQAANRTSTLTKKHFEHCNEE